MERFKACHCCGLVHELPLMQAGQVAVCRRCETTIHQFREGKISSVRTAAAAIGAFILFWPAVLLPILEVQRLGHHHRTSVIGGVVDLFREGSWFVAAIILLFSVIFPLVKIVLLLELSLTGFFQRKHKALTYRVMEHLGRWSMMDVLFLGFLVMLVKLGSLIEFHIGPAVFAFAACVFMSMVASLLFDPHAIWED